MNKRIISAAVGLLLTLSAFGGFTVTANAADTSVRTVEYLSRGLTAIKVDGGIYLSWRLLGEEDLKQTFDIYRDGEKIETNYDATNYTDNEGFSYNNYQVVPSGTAAADVDLKCDLTGVWQQNYIDIPLDRPAGDVARGGESYTYSINDTSVADVDGDGEYEYIIKWDPSNSKDNSQHGYTGNVLLDCYKLDGTKLWRIDLGVNIRAGAHYTQFIAYDFDGDGKAEVAMRTAPGSKDSTGDYVSRVSADCGNDKFTWKDSSTGKEYKDTDDLRQSGQKYGHIIQGPDWLTMFNGETGVAMQTVNYPVQRGAVKSWGDNYGGRSERFLAGVAYLNGQTPSLIMCRGYYARASMSAYNWDGSKFTQLWKRDDKSDTNTLYSNGNHQLSVADVDNDGKDEVIFGSAVVDDNGNMLNSTGHGHGDALHVSDFDNDGEQEVFQVHEEPKYCNEGYAAEYRKARTGKVLSGDALAGKKADCGRGVMANIDDEYAFKNGFYSYYWSVANGNLYKNTGTPITETRTVDGKPVTTNVAQPSSYNSFCYWDGDLSRELLDRNRIDKYSVEGGQQRLVTFNNVHTNNSSKENAALSADLFGDWREEVAYGLSDNTALRIFTTTIPTEYKLTTLMHDTQYRCAVAWQNVGYNQPPHTSYYIGKASLVNGKNYLSPATEFDKVQYTHTPKKVVTVPEEEITLLSTSNSFKDDNWGIGQKTTTAAPYNDIVTTSSGITDKELDLELESDETFDIILTSFTLAADTATVVINNESPSLFNAKLYIAAYDDNQLLSDVKIKNISVEGGSTETITTDAIVVPEGGSVRAYLWDNNQKSYTEALSAENTEITNRIIKTVRGTVETLKFAFDWKPSADTNSISIMTENKENLVRLSKKLGNSVQYSTGKNSEQTVNSTLTSNSSWYHIVMTLDTTSKTADIAVTDYTNSSPERIVYAASFAGVDGLPSFLRINNATSLDNVSISKVTYNVERSLLRFNVKDSSDKAVKDAKIQVGSNTLTTDEAGNAAIKLKNGDYIYTISKEAFKTTRGDVTADSTQNISETIIPGEQRNVYIKYMYDNAIDINEAVADSGEAVATAVENSKYTLSDDIKKDILGYTFASGEDDIVPGYEALAGETYNLEFDSDNSDVVDVVVGENADTTIVLSYKIKYSPTEADTSLLNIQYGEGGINSTANSWSVTNNSYERINENGKYIRIANLGDSKLTVNIPNTSDKLVMEFDMRYEDMSWGGNYFGLTTYSGKTAGQGLAMRTSGEGNGQWQLCYMGGKENYLPRTSECSDKAFSYAYNWKNQWMHMIVVCDGTQLKVTQINKDTGLVYIQDQAAPLLKNVGTKSSPINKIVFERILGSGTAAVGFKNFKAYNIGNGVAYSETTRRIDVPSTTVLTASVSHNSAVENIKYDASAFLGEISYELRDANNNPVNDVAGITLSSNGVLTTSSDFDISVPYKVVVKLDGRDWYGYNLTYRTKSLLTKTFKGFGSEGDLGNFSITKKDGYSIENVNGTLKYSRVAGTAFDENVYLTFPITKDELDDEFFFLMDYKYISGSAKGNMYLSNTSSHNQHYLKAETRLYEPRFKFNTNPSGSGTAAFNASSGLTADTWYTFVYHGTGMSTDSRNIKLDIYKTADLDAAGYTTNSHRDYSNVKDVTPVFSINITPGDIDRSSGMYLAWEVTQTVDKGSIDFADEWYFDNMYYQYYDYQ